VKKLIKGHHKEAEEYFEKLRDIHIHYGKDVLFVKLDEVNIPFDLGAEYSVESQGTNQVPVGAHKHSKEACTISAGVSSDRQVILPVLIFESKYRRKNKREAPIEHSKWIDLTFPCMAEV